MPGNHTGCNCGASSYHDEADVFLGPWSSCLICLESAFPRFVSEWLDWSILRSTGQQGWGLTEAGIFPNWNCLKKVRVKSTHFWVENQLYKITTFLLITMINYFQAEGLTAIECWVIACIIFVFGALLEYTVILLKLKLKKVLHVCFCIRIPKMNS